MTLTFFWSLVRRETSSHANVACSSTDVGVRLKSGEREERNATAGW